MCAGINNIYAHFDQFISINCWFL